MKYYELEDDLYFEGRWHLCELMDDTDTELDAREFTYGNQIDSGPPMRCSLWNEDKLVSVKPPLQLLSSRAGTPLDFTYTDAHAPVVTKRVAELLSKLADNDVQRFPVKVEKMREEYEIINVTSCIDCIDTERSEIQWFEEGNSIRPDLAGQPEMIRELLMDTSRVGDHHIFRPVGWKIVIIVSEVIKEAFEKAGVTGIRFVEV